MDKIELIDRAAVIADLKTQFAAVYKDTMLRPIMDDDPFVELLAKSEGRHMQMFLDGLEAYLMKRPTIDAAPVRRSEWKIGAIIAGYQGIGKSTLAKSGGGYIDLESGNFFVDGKRSDDWYVIYGQIAMHLAQQGYRVFVSSHAVVRNWLADHKGNVPLYVVFPSYSLKSAWLNKLGVRYEASGLDKDYRAWQGAIHRYDDNVKELHESKGFVPIVIHDMDYSLSRLLDRYCGADMRKEAHHEPEG